MKMDIYNRDDEEEFEEENEEKEVLKDEKLCSKEKGRNNEVSYNFLKKMMKNKGRCCY
jgi:hypothetical protein